MKPRFILNDGSDRRAYRDELNKRVVGALTAAAVEETKQSPRNVAASRVRAGYDELWSGPLAQTLKAITVLAFSEGTGVGERVSLTAAARPRRFGELPNPADGKASDVIDWDSYRDNPPGGNEDNPHQTLSEAMKGGEIKRGTLRVPPKCFSADEKKTILGRFNNLSHFIDGDVEAVVYDTIGSSLQAAGIAFPRTRTYKYVAPKSAQLSQEELNEFIETNRIEILAKETAPATPKEDRIVRQKLEANLKWWQETLDKNKKILEDNNITDDNPIGDFPSKEEHDKVVKMITTAETELFVPLEDRYNFWLRRIRNIGENALQSEVDKLNQRISIIDKASKRDWNSLLRVFRATKTYLREINRLDEFDVDSIYISGRRRVYRYLNQAGELSEHSFLPGGVEDGDVEQLAQTLLDHPESPAGQRAKDLLRVFINESRAGNIGKTDVEKVLNTKAFLRRLTTPQKRILSDDVLGRAVDRKGIDTIRKATQGRAVGIFQGAVDQVAKRVCRDGVSLSDALGELDFGKWASDITSTASNEALAALAKRMDVDGQGQKEWRASFHNSREDHILADGQVVGVKEDFVVGGEKMPHPHWSGASPKNTFNCLCFMNILTDYQPTIKTSQGPVPTGEKKTVILSLADRFKRAPTTKNTQA